MRTIVRKTVIFHLAGLIVIGATPNRAAGQTTDTQRAAAREILAEIDDERSGWAKRRRPGREQFEFLVDAYRLRLDEDAMRGEVLEWLKMRKAGMDDPIAARLPATAMLLNVPLFQLNTSSMCHLINHSHDAYLVMKKY